MVKRKRDAASSTTKGHDFSSSSFPSSGWEYEVFLSFRGPDTRKTFTDHLYNGLVSRGIRTFIDNAELPIGEEIDLALRSAIHESKIAIPIFSKDYASSKWCLRELAEIVECMKQEEEGQRQITVMPVFYHVDPSDVRYQIGCYKEAFQMHEKRYAQETERWKKALKEVADLKGWDVEKIADGHEGKLIQLIVKEVWSELRKSPLIVSDNLVGIHSHVEEVKKFLNIGSDDDIRIVGILGLGGIGKTTIARCVYNTLHHHFEGCSFLADSRETFQTRGPVHLQCQLLINILNLENPNISNVDQGIDMIKQRLSNKKVLIVVDDVDENTNLNVIIGKCGWFGIGSRIIITTRDRCILDVLGVDSIYEPNEMDLDQSLLLFSRHAFKRNQPPEQYLDLSKDMIKTAGGLPLALEVLGSSLVGKRESAWKDMMKKLKEIPNHKVMEKLRISYDGLDRVEKEMFLDIACFFIRLDKDIACYIWDGCDFFPQAGIEVLLQKSLVKIDENNELRMHDQLRDLGREIVRQENPKKPGKRSRLWLQREVLDVLSTQRGTSKVEGLFIDSGYPGEVQCLKSEGFASMPKLRLLQADCSSVAGNFVHSFSELRWLSWEGCPAEFTPTNLRKLVVLDLSYSRITENWMGWNYIKEAETLKVLNLSGCDQLSRTPDFSGNLHLEILILEGCSNLATIDESIGHLKRLVSLYMNNCTSLRCLPTTICELSSLKKLEIKSTNIGRFPEKFGSLSSLEFLSLEGNPFHSLPATVSALSLLQTLSVARCYNLQSLPRLSLLTNLEVLRLDRCENLAEIPTTIDALTRLKSLNLRRCHALQYIQVLPSGLTNLDVDECRSLREISAGFSNMRNLVQLCVSGCHNLAKIERIEGLYSLERLTIEECRSLRKIEGLEGLDSLEQLIIKVCPSLRRISKLSCSNNLVRKEITDCHELSEIESLEEGLDSLEQLIIKDCRSLRKIPKLCSKNCVCIEIIDCHELSKIEGLEEGLDSLKKLIVGGCRLLRKIPNLSYSKNLVCIEIRNCRKLSEIEELKGLYFLEKLIITGCHSLRKIPKLSAMKNLVSIEISFCPELSEIEGLKGLDSLEELQLSISVCHSLTKIHLPKKLSKLYLNECPKLEIEGLEDLEACREFSLLYLRSIIRLPCLSNLKTLKNLQVWGLEMLREFPSVDKLESLEILDVAWWTSIERLPDLSNLTKLGELCIRYCWKLTEIQGVDRLENLKMLHINGCISIETLPCLSNLRNLWNLSVTNCKKLTEIQGVDKLEALTNLCIDGCKSIEALPCLSNLRNLRNLSITNCKKLTEIQGVDKLESLTDLCIDRCKSIEALPCLSNLRNLRNLSVINCKKLTEIQGVDKLESLTNLRIDGCISIEALPCLSNLKKLQNLSAGNYKKLTEIQGVDKLESSKKLTVRGCVSMKLEAFDARNSNASSSSRMSYGEFEIRYGDSSLAPDLGLEIGDDDSSSVPNH